VYGTLAIPEAINADGSPADPEHTDYFREDTPLCPHSPYSASKCSADLFVKAYHDTYGFPAVITRCSNNYGPYQFPEKLIPLMINNAIHHKSLPVYGDGLNVRDWLYVDDHCKAIDMVATDGRLGEVYNVGGHNERANIYIVKTIIAEVAKVTGDPQVSEDLITYVADRAGHDRRYGMAPDKIREELGWYPETPYEQGIVKPIRWYLDNPAWVANVTSGAYQDYYERMYAGR
jgi:dTDP-glucose 4,6-dehydratase